MESRAPIKVVLIGKFDSKSAFMNELRRETGGDLNDLNHMATIGVDFKNVNYNNERFQIWDTAGQERFFGSTGVFLKNASVVIYCDPTDAQRENVNVFLAESSDAVNIKLLDAKGMAPLACLEYVQQVEQTKRDTAFQAEQRAALLVKQSIFPVTTAKLDRDKMDAYLSKENDVTASIHNNL